jgi:hypothetical protein
MDRFRRARDKGGAYLMDQQRSDGSFGDPVKGATEYYKVPAALLVCGESEAANRLCSWVRKHGMTPDGDFGPRPDEAKDSYYYAYHNVWIILAAQRLGQFDLSHIGMDFLLEFWDPESGGFYSSPTEREAHTLQDLWVVSGCGIAAVYTGMIDVAKGVGHWMERLMSLQPNYPEQMYTVYSREQGLHTPEEPEDEFRYVLNSDAERDQSFFHPGIAGGFLARLYQATGEEEWLVLAREYMRFADGASDYLWRLLRAGKVGWCAAVLYTLTGEGKYKDMALRVGDNLVATQSDEGYWSMTGSDGPSNDATAEMVVWLDEIYQAVGGV